MMKKAFSAALLLTTLAGCGVSAPAVPTPLLAKGLSAQSTSVLTPALTRTPILTSAMVAQATTVVQKALDVRIPDATTTVNGLKFTLTNQQGVLAFTGIEIHDGMFYQFESEVAGTVDLATGKVATSSPVAPSTRN